MMKSRLSSSLKCYEFSGYGTMQNKIIIIIIIIIELTFNERFQDSDIAAAISLGHYYCDTLWSILLAHPGVDRFHYM